MPKSFIVSGDLRNFYSEAVYSGIFATVHASLRMAATLLLVSHWYELNRSASVSLPFAHVDTRLDNAAGKLRPQLTVRTKVVAFVGAGLLLFVIPGMVLTYLFDYKVLGALLASIPLIIDLVFVLAATIAMTTFLKGATPGFNRTTLRRIHQVRSLPNSKNCLARCSIATQGRS